MQILIKKTLRQFGFELRRYRPGSSETAQLMAMLEANGIDLILDVGANTGQFGTTLRVAGYVGRIVSFEPLSTAWLQLRAESDTDPLWDVAPQAAIGSEDGEIDVHIAGNLQSSSVLRMLDAHSNAAPDSAYVGVERVPMRRLDSAALGVLDSNSRTFLKIDTQGYEDRVLAGARGILDRICGIQLELSLVPLYAGQKLCCELIDTVQSLGFDLWSISPVFVDQKTGRLLQLDATFFRS